MAGNHSMHPDDMASLYSNTLLDFQWARTWELTQLGFDERSAGYFAMLEIENKKKLAPELGPARALLSDLVFQTRDNIFSCAVRYTPPPRKLEKMIFDGFDRSAR